MTVGNTVKDHNSENSGSTTKKKAFSCQSYQHGKTIL